MGADVFLSYSIKDKAVAEAIVARLEADSVTCWNAPRDILPGTNWGESISANRTENKVATCVNHASKIDRLRQPHGNRIC
jgi:hypothetical protein